ncbi:MAG: nucleotidyl transferase AbiEii/AbiGii toxin family protein [Deltaproteobacteria bacterium]|nr:nucleotidyl transferase AbiEii/AbiGii toxin family protein [Deltaproteobacteria bacterium]
MHEAIARMLSKYETSSIENYTRAIREIFQEITLLGLWRGKFFERAAFYGGTALRVIYGLDRFSEDLDFTLLSQKEQFDMSQYTDAAEKEIKAFGFDVHIEVKKKTKKSEVQSAFLKAQTIEQLILINAPDEVTREIPRGQVIKIRLEVDIDPPPSFQTDAKYLLTPIPFSVRTVALPDLFAGKMHAVLCRRWKTRVKGRDWYDLVWFVTYYPKLHLAHLEARMRQTGDWNEKEVLTQNAFMKIMHERIESLDVGQARREVEAFVKNPDSLIIWSQKFFHEIVSRITLQ